jgi:uncharacterized protein
MRTQAAAPPCQAFERAGPPKKLMTVEGSHYAVHDGPAIAAAAADAAREWLVAHLSGEGPGC